MKIASLLAIFLGLAGTGAVAAPQTRVCAKYSTILLEEGERAEVDGAGPFSVSLRITGSRGNWIFYDSLSEPSSADSEAQHCVNDRCSAHVRKCHEPDSAPARNIGFDQLRGIEQAYCPQTRSFAIYRPQSYFAVIAFSERPFSVGAGGQSGKSWLSEREN